MFLLISNQYILLSLQVSQDDNLKGKSMLNIELILNPHILCNICDFY